MAPTPKWSDEYAVLSARLTERLGSEFCIEHVGSTSVPGLVAKPVIDLAVRVPSGRTVTSTGSELRELGWTDPIPIGAHHATFLQDGRGLRRAIAHLFTAEQWEEAHVRLFAGWLRRHPVDRDRYARLKQGLVESGVWGSDYTIAKRAFVQEIVNQARSEVGLGPVELAR